MVRRAAFLVSTAAGTLKKTLCRHLPLPSIRDQLPHHLQTMRSWGFNTPRCMAGGFPHGRLRQILRIVADHHNFVAFHLMKNAFLPESFSVSKTAAK